MFHVNSIYVCYLKIIERLRQDLSRVNGPPVIPHHVLHTVTDNTVILCVYLCVVHFFVFMCVCVCV